jgi:hypothetical protein
MEAAGIEPANDSDRCATARRPVARSRAAANDNLGESLPLPRARWKGSSGALDKRPGKRATPTVDAGKVFTDRCTTRVRSPAKQIRTGAVRSDEERSGHSDRVGSGLSNPGSLTHPEIVPTRGARNRGLRRPRERTCSVGKVRCAASSTTLRQTRLACPAANGHGFPRGQGGLERLARKRQLEASEKARDALGINFKAIPGCKGGQLVRFGLGAAA